MKYAVEMGAGAMTYESLDWFEHSKGTVGADLVHLIIFLINDAPRHEDLWGSGGIAPPFFWLFTFVPLRKEN
jgi:hypothetical protein